MKTANKWLAINIVVLVCIFGWFAASTHHSVHGQTTTANAIGNPAAAFTRPSYGSTCAVTVSSPASTFKSVFCPVATDPNSVTARTYSAGYLVPGKIFTTRGGGTYTVPVGNAVTASVKIMIGSATVMNITTPAAPVGTNASIDFYATCTIVTSTQASCEGMFFFVVVGTTSVPVPFPGTLATFDPTVPNTVDVLGTWNTGQSTQTTTVNVAAFKAEN